MTPVRDEWGSRTPTRRPTMGDRSPCSWLRRTLPTEFSLYDAPDPHGLPLPEPRPVVESRDQATQTLPAAMPPEGYHSVPDTFRVERFIEWMSRQRMREAMDARDITSEQCATHHIEPTCSVAELDQIDRVHKTCQYSLFRMNHEEFYRAHYLPLQTYLAEQAVEQAERDARLADSALQTRLSQRARARSTPVSFALLTAGRSHISGQQFLAGIRPIPPPPVVAIPVDPTKQSNLLLQAQSFRLPLDLRHPMSFPPGSALAEQDSEPTMPADPPFVPFRLTLGPLPAILRRSPMHKTRHEVRVASPGRAAILPSQDDMSTPPDIASPVSGEFASDSSTESHIHSPPQSPVAVSPVARPPAVATTPSSTKRKKRGLRLSRRRKRVRVHTKSQ